MPDPTVMFLYGILLQVVAFMAAKEPDFLLTSQKEARQKWNSEGAWKLDDEDALRALQRDQLIGHVRGLYEWLSVARFILMFIVACTVLSWGAVLFWSPDLQQIGVYTFLVLFSAFAAGTAFPALTCAVLAFLLAKVPARKPL